MSSVKWTVLAHLESQPPGQNFQTQNPNPSILHYSRLNQENLTQSGLEWSTRFKLENPKWVRTVH